MMSPRGNAEEPAAGASSAASPPPPIQAGRSSSGGLLNSLSKMLWSPSQGGAPGTPGAPQSAGSFMTQSPRRGDVGPSPGGAGPSGAAPPPPLAHGSSSADDAAKKGLLDTLFSPVFTFFGSKGEGEGADGAAPPPTAEEEAAAAAAAAQAAAAAAAAAAQAAAEASQQQQQRGSAQPRAPEETDEFDPYTFIRSLPPRPPAAVVRPVCLPKKTRGTHPVSLVLDLDETLLHSSIVPLPTYDIVFPVHFNQVNYQVYVRKRPHMDYFMARVSQWFEIIVFTASQKVYADKLLSIIDPQRKWIKHRVFRGSCVLVDGNYLKDLTVLGRDLAKTAIVDNSPQAFGFQLDNGIPIESWFDDPADTELLKLLPFLERMKDADDVRPLIREHFQLHKLVHGS